MGKSLTRPLQGTPARPEARGRRGRRRGSSGTRRLDERWSGPRLRRGFGGDLARARGVERERAAEMERGVGGGRWGGGRGVEGRGRPYPLRGVAVEAVRRGSPLLRPRSGEQGGRRPREGLGRTSWSGPRLGPGTVHLAQCTVACAFTLLFCFLFFFFSVLFILVSKTVYKNTTPTPKLA